MQRLDGHAQICYVPSLPSLPSDLWKIITRFLTPQERFPLRFVCKKFSYIPPSPKEGLYEPGIIAGSIAYLKWIKQQNYPLKSVDVQLAAYEGKIDVLLWLKEKGQLWDEITFVAAVEKGNLDTLKWLRENGCPWDFYPSLQAAKKGHLELFKWLVNNGCPWNKMHCMAFGTKNIQNWIVQSCKD